MSFYITFNVELFYIFLTQSSKSSVYFILTAHLSSDQPHFTCSKPHMTSDLWSRAGVQHTVREWRWCGGMEWHEMVREEAGKRTRPVGEGPQNGMMWSFKSLLGNFKSLKPEKNAVFAGWGTGVRDKRELAVRTSGALLPLCSLLLGPFSPTRDLAAAPLHRPCSAHIWSHCFVKVLLHPLF